MKKFDEKTWQAEMDADTMGAYAEIMNDPKRKAAAMRVAKAKANDLAKRAEAMRNIASPKTTSSKKK